MNVFLRTVAIGELIPRLLESFESLGYTHEQALELATSFINDLLVARQERIVILPVNLKEFLEKLA